MGRRSGGGGAQKRGQLSKRQRDRVKAMPGDRNQLLKERGNVIYAMTKGAVPLPVGRCIKSRKARYTTEADALKALAYVRRQREAAGSNMVEKRVYQCPSCQGFHMTKLEEWTG